VAATIGVELDVQTWRKVDEPNMVFAGASTKALAFVITHIHPMTVFTV
jgi:hypothetical protein